MDFMATHGELREGDFLLSKDGNYKAILQGDGNFVIYTWKPTWHTNTANNGGTRVVLQSDNSLVMYDQGRKPVWSTSTWNKEHSSQMRLVMTNEGHLVLENDAKEIWSSKDSEGVKN